MDTLAVVLEAPSRIDLRQVALAAAPGADDVIVEVLWSGISTGTERLLFTGRMPPFPGMGYPLVPGYESVGRISFAGMTSGRRVGELVFVPGARCYTDVRPLFGATAQRLVVPGARAVPLAERLAEQGTLMALAATAHHAGWLPGQRGGPDLVVGHGALGRLLARIALAKGEEPPVVWETNAVRRSGAQGYTVLDPQDDTKRTYRRIVDVSGDPDLLDTLIERLMPGGEVVLAGFYAQPLHFAFAPAFLREARLRVAAQWSPEDLTTVAELAGDGCLELDGLITHRAPARDARDAYITAFGDPACVKMILDWSDRA